MSCRRRFSAEFCRSKSEAGELSDRLADFYATTRDYVAFHAPSDQRGLWTHVAAELRRKKQAITDRRLRILEAGAGRSGLCGYLSEEGLRDSVEIHAQDVTAQNSDWLKTRFDSVFVGDVKDMSGEFDIVLSSYVFEHVTEPRQFLHDLLGKATAGGCLFLVCPRYDVPFYLSRSADHFSAVQRVATGFQLLWRRMCTILSGRPAWLVHKDPAVFHLPFFRDRDAVHWVSWFDIRCEWPEAERLRLASGGFRDWVGKNLLTICFRIGKEEAKPLGLRHEARG